MIAVKRALAGEERPEQAERGRAGGSMASVTTKTTTERAMNGGVGHVGAFEVQVRQEITYRQGHHHALQNSTRGRCGQRQR